jgi:hypothetical protein
LKRKTVAVEAKEGQTLDQKAIAAAITDSGHHVIVRLSEHKEPLCLVAALARWVQAGCSGATARRRARRR